MIGTYARAIGIGVIAGMRSMAAPAMVSDMLRRASPTKLLDVRLEPLVRPRVAAGLGVAAAGEMFVDKMPFVPARTDLAPLAGRIGSGAMSGGAVALARRGSPVIGALLGGAAAAFGAWAFYRIRKAAAERTAIPDALVAMTEDLLAIGGGTVLLRNGVGGEVDAARTDGRERDGRSMTDTAGLLPAQDSPGSSRLPEQAGEGRDIDG